METYLIKDYGLYKNYAYGVFKFLAPKITELHKNVFLEVDPFDNVTYTFANFRRPSRINLHLLNIIAYATSQRMIRSMIFIVLAHELFHSEQHLVQDEYNTSAEYRSFIEGSTNKAAYELLLAHKKQIYDEMGLDIDLSYFTDQEIPFCDGYKRCNLEEYYHLLFLNVILRFPKQYLKFTQEILDKYSTTYITFDRQNNFLIKSNGEYCRQTLSAFIRAVEFYTGRFDYYTMCVKLDNTFNRSEHEVLVILEALNGGIYPMAFSD